MQTLIPQRTEAILRAATLALTQTLELDTVLSTLLEYLEQLVPYDAANVMLRVSDTHIAMLAIRGYERWANPDEIRQATYDIYRNKAARTVFTTRHSLLISDTSAYAGWAPAAGAEFVRSWMGIPLLADHDVIGLFSVDKSEPGFFSEEHLERAEVLATHAAIAIHNARMHERLRQQALQLEAANQALKQEIASRKRSEDELRRQNEILQHIFDHAPMILAFYDAEGQFRLVNREWERVLGWPLEEMRGRDMLVEFYPDPAVREEVLKYMLAARPGWREFQTHARDGRVLDTLWANVRLSDGTSIGIGQDITERKRLEARFLQSQKMESVGRLAGGIAHDFNNLLTVIIGFAELALAELAPADPLCANLLEIRRSAERAATLTRQLLAFARKQIISLQVTNLNDLIIDMDRLLRRLIGEHIELIVLPAPDLLPVKIDPHQIEQVLVNLVVNARDAMPHGGKLIIETRNTSLDQAYVQERTGAAAGAHVLLRVIDNGVGMDPLTREHVFEPFFTTKGLGKGTGLGLATCYGIVKQHDGHIMIDSAVGEGTAVEIYLPVVQDAASGAPLVLSHGPLPRGAETILLVEDETSVRRLASRMLRELGYRVIEAQHGEEALQLAESGGFDACDLLLTDVVMPRMGGTELAARLLALRPGLQVLYMSGYTDDQIAERDHLNSEAGFIHKPFSQAALARKLREMLDT